VRVDVLPTLSVALLFDHVGTVRRRRLAIYRAMRRNIVFFGEPRAVEPV
jgi:hypothetical protein